MGKSPRLVAGRADNLKITSPADLELAGAVLAQRAGRA
jgi:2-C-methyl-D-erythritol 4-phosphate cytidylyltransferase